MMRFYVHFSFHILTGGFIFRKMSHFEQRKPFNRHIILKKNLSLLITYLQFEISLTMRQRLVFNRKLLVIIFSEI